MLLLMADDLMNKEIANEMNISVDTVKFHIKNIYKKLGAHSRVQALHLAAQLRILS